MFDYDNINLIVILLKETFPLIVIQENIAVSLHSLVQKERGSKLSTTPGR